MWTAERRRTGDETDRISRTSAGLSKETYRWRQRQEVVHTCVSASKQDETTVQKQVYVQPTTHMRYIAYKSSNNTTLTPIPHTRSPIFHRMGSQQSSYLTSLEHPPNPTPRTAYQNVCMYLCMYVCIDRCVRMPTQRRQRRDTYT